MKPACLLADKGYDTNAIRAKLKADGLRSVIPPKSNRNTIIRWNRRINRERNRIEHRIGHLKLSRAVPTRYDKRSDSQMLTDSNFVNRA